MDLLQEADQQCDEPLAEVGKGVDLQQPTDQFQVGQETEKNIGNGQSDTVARDR